MQETTLLRPLAVGSMANIVYLIQDVNTQRVAVVDPAWEAQRILAEVAALGGQLSDIFLTHSHSDHTNAVAELHAQTQATVHLLRPEAEFWGAQAFPLTEHEDQDVCYLGDTPIRWLHTPGHTPGSACLLVGNDLLTGDTLFVYGCGRCDLRGGDAAQLFASLHKLCTTLPAQTRIHPGHDYGCQPSSTLAEQMQGNPFLQFTELTAFTHYRLYEHDRTRSSPYTPV
ncbi:MBL fold metallo-hydrolase [Thiorhodospira sibirica]|uniref:MBL fold metallo-hydrolase n=1 Tax=Thiorhodospira sibirica TaxID=154347 RepID=UPI00022C0478|nr:MBL fold metallo-hydrolase [Thiorhodospira sibirica]